jgi:hypothetical protein
MRSHPTVRTSTLSARPGSTRSVGPGRNAGRAHTYAHARTQIGTGIGGSMPGTVAAEVKGFRVRGSRRRHFLLPRYPRALQAGDKGVSLCCVGDRLYYRAQGIGWPAGSAVMIVFDTKLLVEIGVVNADGSGSATPACLPACPHRRAVLTIVAAGTLRTHPLDPELQLQARPAQQPRPAATPGPAAPPLAAGLAADFRVCARLRAPGSGDGVGGQRPRRDARAGPRRG